MNGDADRIVLRPDLALRGYDLVESQKAVVDAGEAYVRAKVLPRARAALVRESIEADAKGALAEALRAASNLVNQYDVSATLNWALRTDEAVVRSTLLDLLYSDAPLGDRSGRVFAVAPRHKVEGRWSDFGATVQSYLLCMSAPDRWAFARPVLAFTPAFVLLCTRAGQDAPPSDVRDRVATATQFYAELRDLWAAERGFRGDLLDVHTILFSLGPRGHVEGGWAAAVTPELVAEFVRDFERTTPDLYAALESAGTAVRKLVDVDGSDPFAQLDVVRYGYGTSPASFCYLLEQGTRNFIRVSLGSAAALEVGRAKAGGWRIGARDGHTEEQAAAHYGSVVLPRLRELLEAARAFVTARPCPSLAAPKLAYYRSLDAKTFCLFVAALSPDRAKTLLAGVLKAQRQSSVARLVGAGWKPVTTFHAYFDNQRSIAETVQKMGDLRGFALTAWSYHDERGKCLVAALEPAVDAMAEDDDAEDAPTPPVAAGTPTAVVEAPSEAPDGWDAFIDNLPPDLAEVARLLRTRKNVALYGPPGTGKTHASIQLARAWRTWQHDADESESPSVEQVTFHPSYGYEDFVEAFRPDPADGSRFVLTDGLLPSFAARAAANLDRSYLLLVDEINRGDVARIFGELITLIEHDKRSSVHARKRMLSQKPFWVPPNLHVLATMNTADKSVSLMDVAVRRRFAFVPTPPRPGLLAGSSKLVTEIGGVQMSTLLTRINERLLAIGVLPDRLIGHALLWIDAEVDSPVDELRDRFRYGIIPLVQEYCFSDRSQVARVLDKLVDEHGGPAKLFEQADYEIAFRSALEKLIAPDGD